MNQLRKRFFKMALELLKFFFNIPIFAIHLKHNYYIGLIYFRKRCSSSCHLFLTAENEKFLIGNYLKIQKCVNNILEFSEVS